ncbi:MAG TPA: dihydrodipicolinate synthase family protein [Thermoflexales bacterium]|nr:dihydrodipicolinate synthase family protein [Thermoflexales bacterium]
MKPLTSQNIRGTWGTVLLPINADDSIDYARLGEEIDILIAAGVAGLYTNGTAGEFHTQTEDEFDRIQALFAERCERAGMPFQIGASHMSPQLSLNRVRRSVALRPGAFQVILPDWVTAGHDEAVSFLSRIAEAADGIGLVLYNPPHAKRVLDMAAIGALKRAVPALVGAKVLDGNPSWYGALRAHTTDLSIFVPGHHLASGFLQGASGSYSNVACLSPAGSVRWWKLMQTDIAAAQDIERRLIDFFASHIAPIGQAGYSNPALDKLLAEIGGWADVGLRLRWPSKYLAQAEADRLKPIARAMVPEMFA